MDWQPVNSEAIDEARYEDGVMSIRWRNQSVTDFDVSEDMFNEFMAAPSKGRFYHANLRGLYGERPGS